MKKKALWVSVIILIIVAIPIGFFYVLNNGNPCTKYLADKNVPAYLEEKGYTENEMEESHYVEPKYLINNDYYHGHYMVVFIAKGRKDSLLSNIDYLSRMIMISPILYF